MGLRREAREHALQFIYKYESLTAISNEREKIAEDLRNFWDSFTPGFSNKGKEFTSKLVFTVFENCERIDSLIGKFLKNWKIERLSAIDKNIIRIAIAEFLYFDDIDFSVTINEAIEVAKKFGSQKSSKFVNGVLDKIKIEIENERGRKKECLI